jgi:hypothetical protein
MIIKKEYSCHFCEHTEKVSAPEEDFIKWREGGYIQDVFSYLSLDTRELMISGICGKCYDNFFKEEEE